MRCTILLISHILTSFVLFGQINGGKGQLHLRSLQQTNSEWLRTNGRLTDMLAERASVRGREGKGKQLIELCVPEAERTERMTRLWRWEGRRIKRRQNGQGDITLRAFFKNFILCSLLEKSMHGVHQHINIKLGDITNSTLNGSFIK